MSRRLIIYITTGIIVVSIIVLSLIGNSIFQTNTTLRDDSGISASNIRQSIQEQLDLGPRIPGSNGSLAFKDWLFGKIPSDWKIEVQNFTHLGIEIRNYWITSNYNYSHFPPYVVGAHYDTRARATEDPDANNRNLPVPGANDAGSGVAAILELLRIADVNIGRNVGFVLFDAEDQGSGGMEGWGFGDWIVGSTYFAESLSDDEVSQFKAFILLDMIGDDELTLPYEGNSDINLRESIWTKGQELGYDDIFLKSIGYYLIDDHQPFLERGIPAVDLIDFDYPEWHTIADDIDAISEVNIAIVTDTVHEWLKDAIRNQPTDSVSTDSDPTSSTSSDSTLKENTDKTSDDRVTIYSSELNFLIIITLIVYQKRRSSAKQQKSLNP